jgi:hypothetical protein
MRIRGGRGIRVSQSGNTISISSTMRDRYRPAIKPQEPTYIDRWINIFDYLVEVEEDSFILSGECPLINVGLPLRYSQLTPPIPPNPFGSETFTDIVNENIYDFYSIITGREDIEGSDNKKYFYSGVQILNPENLYYDQYGLSIQVNEVKRSYYDEYESADVFYEAYLDRAYYTKGFLTIMYNGPEAQLVTAHMLPGTSHYGAEYGGIFNVSFEEQQVGSSPHPTPELAMYYGVRLEYTAPHQVSRRPFFKNYYCDINPYGNIIYPGDIIKLHCTVPMIPEIPTTPYDRYLIDATLGNHPDKHNLQLYGDNLFVTLLFVAIGDN